MNKYGWVSDSKTGAGKGTQSDKILRTEAVYSSETHILTYKITRRRNPENFCMIPFQTFRWRRKCPKSSPFDVSK
jgi:hypothetical protein